MRGVYFTILPASPCAAEFYEIWHTRSTQRRNHVCQIFSWSVQGLRSSDTPKIVISHWLAASLLQQCGTTVRHCDMCVCVCYRPNVSCIARYSHDCRTDTSFQSQQPWLHCAWDYIEGCSLAWDHNVQSAVQESQGTTMLYTTAVQTCVSGSMRRRDSLCCVASRTSCKTVVQTQGTDDHRTWNVSWVSLLTTDHTHITRHTTSVSDRPAVCITVCTPQGVSFPRMCESAHQNVYSASFFCPCSSNSLQPRRLNRFSRVIICQTMQFRARMCLFGVRRQKFDIYNP